MLTVAISAWRKYQQFSFYLHFSDFSNFFQMTIQCFYHQKKQNHDDSENNTALLPSMNLIIAGLSQ